MRLYFFFIFLLLISSVTASPFGEDLLNFTKYPYVNSSTALYTDQSIASLYGSYVSGYNAYMMFNNNGCVGASYIDFNYSVQHYVDKWYSFIQNRAGNACINSSFYCDSEYKGSIITEVDNLNFWKNLTVNDHCSDIRIYCYKPNHMDCSNLMEFAEFYFITDEFYTNQYPTLSIIDQKSVYCYNESDNTYDFTLNSTDAEGDSIYYYPFWNDDFQSKITVDDFSDAAYNMQSEGWAFQNAGCNYSTSTGALNLYSGCDSIGMVKWLAEGSLNTSLDVFFDAWVFHNTSNDYCIMNGYNEKLVCLRMASYYDSTYNELYTNFSYWNGSDFIDFDTSYYNDVFSVEFGMNLTHADICISGIDEPAYTGCNYEVTEELHGTTDNIAAKFYMWPFYDFGWTAYQTPYVYIDNLQYREKDYIPWYSYEDGDKVTHLFESQEQEYLTIYVTDDLHTPEYKTYQFPILVQGDCSEQTQFNETEETAKSITDNTRQYVSAVPNGAALFNKGFFFLMLLIFFFILVTTREFPIACIGAGFICLFGSWLLTGDLTQMISSASLVAVGVTILVIAGF